MTVPLWAEDVERTIRPDGITVIRRKAFARDFPYEDGDHVVFGGPTTRGKTTLCFDCLPYIATPEKPAYVAVSKPDDKVTRQRGTALNYRFVEDWPPPPKLGEMLGNGKPSGYIIWPPFGDLNKDMERAAVVTERLLMDRYSAGANPRKNKGGILVMDDTMVKAKIMGLDKHMVTILAMAGAMKLGLWIFIQKPTDSGRTTLWGFENAKHLFFTKGGDEAMKRRYREIIGTDGLLAIKVIDSLEEFQFLYYNRVKGYMCIVGAD